MSQPRSTPHHESRRAVGLKSRQAWQTRQAHDRRGAMVILILFMLVAFLVMVVFSVDVAYMQLVRTQLRSATDAAAKAATDTLSATEDTNQAAAAAREMARLNQVANQPLLLDADDVEFGRAAVQSDGSIQFVPNGTPLGATHVRGRRTADSLSGEVPLVFGQLLNVRTFHPIIESTASRRDRDICLVVDRSGSMAGSKMTDLKDAVDVFLDSLGDTPQDEYVGLASYATSPLLESDLVTDLPLLSQLMSAMVASGRTNIGGGIDVGRGILNRGRGKGFVEKTMVLMTDGIHNTGTDPIEAANRAASDGIVIHAITFGQGAQQSLMRQVATITGGTFNHAPDRAALLRIYRDIALTLITQLTE